MPIDIEKDSPQTALKKLKARENTLRRLEEISKLGSWEVDLRTKKAIWSDQSYKIYGYEPQSFEPTLDLFFSNLLPEYVPSAKMALEKMMEHGHIQTFFAKMRHQKGHIIHILINAQVMYDENGEPWKLIGTTQDITHYVTLQRESKELLEIIEKSSNEIYILDCNTYRYLYVNEGATKRTGYSKEEFASMDVFALNPYLTNEHAQNVKAVLLEKGEAINRTIHKTKMGEEYHVQSYLQLITFQGKEAFIIFDTDITSLVELENKQKEQAKIVQSINDGVIVTDLNGKVKSLNRSVKRILGYENVEKIENIFTEDKKEEVFKLLQEIQTCCSSEEECSIDLETTCHKKNGERIHCELSLTQLRNANGKLYGVVWMFQDISHKIKQQETLQHQAKELEYQALHDTLTGLPNRILFADRLSQAIKHCNRHDKKFALLFVDLDRFKQINDSMGHQFGDKVLLEVSRRIQNVLREEDTLARFGGDEFLVVARDIENKEGARKVAQKILDAFKEPIHLYGQDVYTSISIGISVYPDDTSNEESLVKYADSAMYRAKEEGRSTYRFYSLDMTVKAFEKVVLENALREAIAQKSFEVHFQPQIEVASGKVVGVEALVRWQHPEFGLIAPGRFLPLAEESGLIVEIDRIVMQKAMKVFAKWKKEYPFIGMLSLNLATKQLLREDFIDVLEKTMQENGFDPSWLEFEVTESDVMHNPQSSIEMLHKISEKGISIAMDDFGTGYSSLAYLTKLPLDKLKIDRSFIIEIAHDKSSTEIVKVIIALARTIGLKLVAEGVEKEIQREYLYNLGCPTIQGYLYSRPLAASEFESYIKQISSH